ncbi:MAG TPA: B12-binding domain-containing radical SAM protein [bacterium]|nr:B12-binding domain-containing radical SAM protein [bacterium]
MTPVAAPPPRCLFVYPHFSSQSFWNYRATCEVVGAKYPAAPLGLITVAAMLPPEWEVRLADLNAGELDGRDVEWADMVFLGGMIAQQPDHIHLIDYFRSRGKTVVTGGPDATSSPHLYDRADHLVLGEAEVTLPRFLADFAQGAARHLYEAGEKKAAMADSPIPRFDLLKFDNYLHVGIQWNRGCPFMCEFCDIIELFGRVPRGKSIPQVLGELQRLYDLGYRGHIDIVDDNFIGNKKDVKVLLPHLIQWLTDHDWPFEFSTEASINLADDEELLGLMQEAGFNWLFVGIENPDEETLKATQKRQNTHRSIAESVHKIMRRGMIVNAGYIMGFDGEKGNVAQAILDNIEATAVPVNMVGLLFALPNTQLTRRLQREGRLGPDFEIPPDKTACQCVAGLNFTTLRPKFAILKDFRRVVEETLRPGRYFGRVLRLALMQDCSKKRLKLPWRQRLKNLRSFFRLIREMGWARETRRGFWKTLITCGLRNPRALRNAVSLVALYLHFGPFRDFVLGRLDDEILHLEKNGVRPVPSPIPGWNPQPVGGEVG